MTNQPDEMKSAGKHYPEEWGPSGHKELTCICGNNWPCPHFVPGVVPKEPPAKDSQQVAVQRYNPCGEDWPAGSGMYLDYSGGEWVHFEDYENQSAEVDRLRLIAHHSNEIAIQSIEKRAAVDKEVERLRAEVSKLQDPQAVWVNMLMGKIARPQALDHYEECKTKVDALTYENNRLRERVKALEKGLNMAIAALEQSYDATEWPADGTSTPEMTAKEMRTLLGKEAE